MWHPIETAPKDGRTILIVPHKANGNEVRPAYWDADMKMWALLDKFHGSDTGYMSETSYPPRGWKNLPRYK